MLPTTNDDTLKSAAFGAEVGGRAQGVATMANLVADSEKRAGLERSGARIVATAREAGAACCGRRRRTTAACRRSARW